MAHCMRRRGIENPYTVCKTKPLPDLCITQWTEENKDGGVLYPSIFAAFKFKITGYENAAIPDPGNEDMYIKAKVGSFFGVPLTIGLALKNKMQGGVTHYAHAIAVFL